MALIEIDDFPSYKPPFSHGDFPASYVSQNQMVVVNLSGIFQFALYNHY